MNLLHHWILNSNYWKRTVREEIVPWGLTDVHLGDKILELGPGPGVTTDLLRQSHRHITCLEIDPQLAHGLRQSFSGTNVTVVNGDAASLPFPDGTFSGAVAFTMLHHVPSPKLQDRILAEVCRVLRPAGVFAGTDSRWSLMMPIVHLFDTMVLVPPESMAARLKAAGFADVRVDTAKSRFRFVARKPATPA
ncbi:MAG TPA: class I SAM-dependent methyltransferase [Terriglobales bacterium]|nr:class I SAM-dependent methyltransferase [Terriglobales bacterium]